MSNEQEAKRVEVKTVEAADGQALLDKIIDEGRWKDPASRTSAKQAPPVRATEGL